MASEEPASASAPATKDMGLSPKEERLQKLEILLGKLAKHVGLVEDESSSEDAEFDCGGSVVLEKPASSLQKGSQWKTNLKWQSDQEWTNLPMSFSSFPKET